MPTNPNTRGGPRDPQQPPINPDGGPERRRGPANQPINPEPDVPSPDPEPVPVREPQQKPGKRA